MKNPTQLVQDMISKEYRSRRSMGTPSICPNCGSTHITRVGIHNDYVGGRVYKILECRDCGTHFEK